jgi:hypothetical protein
MLMIKQTKKDTLMIEIQPRSGEIFVEIKSVAISKVRSTEILNIYAISPLRGFTLQKNRSTTKISPLRRLKSC